MRKKLLLLAVSLLGMASAQAQTLSVDGNKFEVLKGKTGTLVVNVGDANNQVRDVQFDITLPEGVTLGDVTPDANTYQVAISDPKAVTGGNKYTVIVYSENAAKGAKAINFPLDATDFAGELWVDLTSSIPEGTWTNDAATEAAASITGYTFQVGLLGDANKDAGVTVTDAIAVLDIVAQNYPENLAADANEDGSFTVTDAIAVLDIVANQ